MTVRQILFLLAVAGGIAGLFYAGWIPRQRQLAAVTAVSNAEQKEVPLVTVTAIRSTEKPMDLLLPATVSAIKDTPVYARAEGYIVKLYVDIGDYVKAGQVLVDIDSPEQDQQLRSARARLAQLQASLAQAQAAQQVSRANLKLATITVGRMKQLVAEGVMSKQAGDEAQAQFEARQADLGVQQANVNAARESIRTQEAEVQRLAELNKFKQVTAPFEGLITARNCALGNLITPAALSTGRDLYRLSNIETLRIFINTPQANVGDVFVGQSATITMQENPALKFKGTVVRTANALDPNTRTLLTEVSVKNQGRALLPGMYAQALLEGKTIKRTILIPGDTLLTRAQGPQVAVVRNGRVRYQRVEIGRDYGLEMEVTKGLQGDEILVVNPSDDVREGAAVRMNKRKS